MKRCFALILALCLVCLCGCGAEDSPEAETPAPAAETPALTPAPFDPSPLHAIFTEIGERMHPGTAGSSLTALQLGAMLLDWSVTTELDEAQIRAAVEDYLASLDEVGRSEFRLQTASVKGAVSRLLSENAEALLEDVGGTEGTLWPWENVPADKLDAVFDAAGVNELVNDPNQ